MKDILVVARLNEGKFEKFMGFMQSKEGINEKKKIADLTKTLGTVSADKSAVMFKIFCTDEAALHKFVEGTEVFTVLSNIETFSMKHEANAKLYIRGDQMLNWKGVVYSNLNKFNLNAELQGSFHQPIVVKADYVKSKEKVLLSGTLASGGVSLELKSKSEITLDSLRTKALLKYDVPSYGKGSVDLAAKIRDVQQGLLVTKIISFDIKVRIFCAYKTLDFQTDFTLHNLKT